MFGGLLQPGHDPHQSAAVNPLHPLWKAQVLLELQALEVCCKPAPTCTVPSCLKSHSLRLLSLAAVSRRSGCGEGRTHRMAPAWSRTCRGGHAQNKGCFARVPVVHDICRPWLERPWTFTCPCTHWCVMACLTRQLKPWQTRRSHTHSRHARWLM
jgi:hypothetical protein